MSTALVALSGPAPALIRQPRCPPRSNLHAQTFAVRIKSCSGAYVRIEVEDDGGPWLVPAPDPGSGRGLDIIRVLAAGWGVTTSPAGRTVWAWFDWPSR